MFCFASFFLVLVLHISASQVKIAKWSQKSSNWNVLHSYVKCIYAYIYDYVKYIYELSTGPCGGRGLLEPGFWPRAELRPKGEDHRAAGQGGVSHQGEVAVQESTEGGHGTRQCASEAVTARFDYSDGKKNKDKARAFHACKMSLARQVCILNTSPSSQKYLSGSTVVRLYSCQELRETSILLQ